MSLDLLVGWLLGLVSSLATGVLLFWLEGKREIRLSQRTQRLEDSRIARNWSASGKLESLRGFDLAGANLAGKDLSNADLEDADLSGTRLWATNFTNANLRRTNFSHASVVEANFSNAQMHSANFDKAEIARAKFSGASLRRTKFSRAKKLEQCIWENAQIDSTTELYGEIRDSIERLSQHKN